MKQEDVARLKEIAQAIEALRDEAKSILLADMARTLPQRQAYAEEMYKKNYVSPKRCINLVNLVKELK